MLSAITLAAIAATYPLWYSNSYILESIIGLSLATPIGLPLASFGIFLTLDNYGLYPPQSNGSSIFTYLL